MLQSVEVVINFKFINWAWRFCILAINNTDYFGFDYKMCYFTCAKGPTFWSFIVERMKWSDMEGSHVIYVMSSSTCGWLHWSLFGSYSCWILLYVVWATHKAYHHVDLWSMFMKLAYGVFDTTIARSFGQQMILSSMHQKPRFLFL